MRKLMCTLGILAMLATTMICMNSCKSDEPSDQVKVVNNTGSITLRAFTFKFFTASGELLLSTDVGTFNPGDTKSMNIPTGAEKWRVGAYVNDDWEFSISPEYSISTKTLKLSYNEVHDGWSYNYDRY